jgi:ABC-type Mn2+/Zn2+ transport system permease subunit
MIFEFGTFTLISCQIIILFQKFEQIKIVGFNHLAGTYINLNCRACRRLFLSLLHLNIIRSIKIQLGLIIVSANFFNIL